MPLYVKSDDVAALAEQYREIIGAASKTEALRLALTRQIAAERRATPLATRVVALQDDVARLGPTDPDFDAKAFLDEMWGE